MSDLAERLHRPNALHAGVLMTARSLRLSIRNLDAIFTALFLPVMIMLLFVYLFGGAINTGTRYVTYVVPGILLLCAGFGAALTAVTVTQDMAEGIVDRFRSMDVNGAAVLGGHVMSSLARNLASTAMLLAIGYAIGFRPTAGPLEWLGTLGMLMLWVLAISWVSAAFGLVVRSVEAANGLGFFVMFLPYPSSAFVPIDTMPSWIHGFARHQPCTAVIETLRGLLLGTPIGSYAWQAVAWCVGIVAVSMMFSAILFRRRVG
jgi:ABC-2 type transport system permease protein